MKKTIIGLLIIGVLVLPLFALARDIELRDVTKAGDLLGKFRGFGWDGTQEVENLRFAIIATENAKENNVPSKLIIQSRNGVPEFTKVAEIDDKGNLIAYNGVMLRDTLYLLPKATPPSNPGKGFLYVDSDTNELCFYDGTSWTGLKAGGTCA